MTITDEDIQAILIKSTHGGFRKGAGRPRLHEKGSKKFALRFSLPPHIAEQLEQEPSKAKVISEAITLYYETREARQ